MTTTDDLLLGLHGAAEASKHDDLSDLFVSKEEEAAAAASESDSFERAQGGDAQVAARAGAREEARRDARAEERQARRQQDV
jgi:hypothetical protein